MVYWDPRRTRDKHVNTAAKGFIYLFSHIFPVQFSVCLCSTTKIKCSIFIRLLRHSSLISARSHVSSSSFGFQFASVSLTLSFRFPRRLLKRRRLLLSSSMRPSGQSERHEGRTKARKKATSRRAKNSRGHERWTKTGYSNLAFRARKTLKCCGCCSFFFCVSAHAFLLSLLSTFFSSF